MLSAKMDTRIIHWTSYLVATTEGSTVASRPFRNGAFVLEWKRKEERGRDGRVKKEGSDRRRSQGNGCKLAAGWTSRCPPVLAAMAQVGSHFADCPITMRLPVNYLTKVK